MRDISLMFTRVYVDVVTRRERERERERERAIKPRNHDTVSQEVMRGMSRALDYEDDGDDGDDGDEAQPNDTSSKRATIRYARGRCARASE